MSGPQEATAMDCRGQGLQGLAARGPGPGGVRSVTNQMLAVMVMCCKAGRKKTAWTSRTNQECVARGRIKRVEARVSVALTALVTRCKDVRRLTDQSWL